MHPLAKKRDQRAISLTKTVSDSGSLLKPDAIDLISPYAQWLSSATSQLVLQNAFKLLLTLSPLQRPSVNLSVSNSTVGFAPTGYHISMYSSIIKETCQ